jgi:hypothetical protein
VAGAIFSQRIGSALKNGNSQYWQHNITQYWRNINAIFIFNVGGNIDPL